MLASVQLFFAEGLLANFDKKMKQWGSDASTRERFLARVQDQSAWSHNGRYYWITFTDEAAGVEYVARAYRLRTTNRIEVLTLRPSHIR